MRARLGTAAILIPLVLFVVLLHNNVTFLALSGGLVAFGVSELATMMGMARRWPWLASTAWLALSGAVLVERLTAWPLAIATLLFASSLVALADVGKKPLPWRLELGSMWIGAPFIAIMVLHEYGRPASGLWYSPNCTLMTLLPVWAGDTFAIIAGKTIGKHPLAPQISPGKTVEGGLANLGAALILSFITGSFLGLSPLACTLCGLATGLGGQLGDLFESFVKRQLGVKDSSNFLPGHGGFLDRMDSLFFSAVPVAISLFFLR